MSASQQQQQSGRPSLGGSSSLATLQRAFPDSEASYDGKRERQQRSHENITDASFSKMYRDLKGLERHAIAARATAAEAAEQNSSLPPLDRSSSSPAFSIDAISDSSDDDMMSALIRHTSRMKSSGSPRIGDLTWSSQETGPFGVMPKNNATTQESLERADAAPVRPNRRNGDEQEFDLEGAIADLLSEDEARRRARRLAASGVSTPDGSSKMSTPDMASTRNADMLADIMRTPQASSNPHGTRQNVTDNVHTTPKTAAVASGDTSIGSRSTLDTNFNTATPRRLRQGSSPGTKVARLPSASSSQSVRAKRSSTSSIGQSILRGSLPLGAAEEYEGRLNSVDDDAAEALRKLDGITSPRSSRIRDPSRSPRSSKQLSRPNSAGRRTPGNASRASSPSNKSITSSRTQREDPAAPRSGSSSRRVSRTITGSKPAKGEEIAPTTAAAAAAAASHSLDSPRRGSISSPRAKRNHLPPLPTPTGSIALGLATPPSSTAPLQSATSMSTAAVSNVPSAAKRTSATSFSSTNSIPAPRTSTSIRSKRGSDISLTDPQQGSNTNAGLGLITVSSNNGVGGPGGDDPTFSPASANNSLYVPPVPPLPKAWESSRSMSSFISESNLASIPTYKNAETSVRNVAPIASRTSAGSAANTSSEKETGSQTDKSPSLKWSLSNLSTTLTSKKSEERLVSRKSMPAEQAKGVSATRAPMSAARASLRPERATLQQPHADDSRIGRSDNSASSATANSSTSSLVPTTPASLSHARLSNDILVQTSPSTTASPRSRRTPSFFRKRSSDASRSEEASRKGKKSPLLSHSNLSAQNFDHSIDNASDALLPPRSDATTPSGRSSRKSILGLGSLLRSASRRNIDSMPTSISTQTLSKFPMQQPASAVGDDTTSSHESTISKTPSSKGSNGPLNSIRRASLIGRKRGKTLSTTADPPAKPESQALPPMQMPPLTEQQQSPPRKRGDSTGAASLSNDVVMIGRRRLTNSSSTGDLGSHRDKTGAPSLPTINASPSTIVSTTSDATLNLRDSIHTPGKRVVSGNDVSAPASRIPRPTASSSKRQPALSASQSSAMVRRLSGTSALPTSKTSASLASHLGIAAKPMDNESITSSYTTDTMFNAETPTSPVSATASPSALVNILNAYTNAKTPAEVEVVLRRAKLASHSTAFSAREREVLVSLVTRQEEKRKQQQAQMLPPSASSAQMTGERATFDVDHLPSKASLFATPQTARHYGAERTLTGPRASVSGLSSSTNSTLNALTASVPARRTRASMTTSSSAARAAREVAAQAAASAPISSRLSTPSSVRDSPALYETMAGRQSSSAISPSPSSLGFSAVDDEEREGDEEIESYIRRRHSRKVAQGARLADLEKLLEFPTDERPAKAYSYRQAEALWGDKLTSVELEEIRTFKEIFFVGQNVDKDARASAEGATAQNGGYDDERGDYLVINHDHLAYRYEVMSLLGRGSFGQVLQCKDHKTGRYVAIKLIRNKRRFHHQALVEVKILENLTKWDPNEEFNVIKVLDSFYFRNHLCISMELLSINLYELIKANSFAGFSTKLIRRITSQVLSSLVLLRRNRVVHCDLKPENILLKHPRKSAIKVIDFGSSCFEHEKVYTYIQSRFYRSPEVILGMNYHTAIDIWSLGCIIAELYSGYPLFPGENEQEQLACIMEVLGIPDRYIVDRSSRKKLFFDSTGAPRPVVNSKGKRRRPSTKTLASVLNCNDDLFIDFLTRCLHWDPERRIKPDAAMRHPWIRRQGGGGGMTSSTTSRRISMLPASSTTSNIVSHAAGTTAASNGFPTSSSSSAGGAPQALTSRRTLASSITTSALSSAAGKSSMGMSTSSSKPSALSGSQSGNPRHERRLSLRTSVNGSNASNTVNPISPSETNKHTPLRSSRRSQQPVQ